MNLIADMALATALSAGLNWAKNVAVDEVAKAQVKKSNSCPLPKEC